MGLKKSIKSLLQKKRSYPTENTIRFIHHEPSRGNIGDFLCSPRHYLSFTSNIKSLSIIGGGVFAQFALPKLKKEKISPSSCILWGVGISNRDIMNIPPKVDTLPYLAWGVRDKDILDSEEKFLPCVSCLHPMLDTAISKDAGILLFLNADPKVTNPEAISKCQKISSTKNWTLLFNNCSEKEFTTEFSKSKHIITNSYHGAYWGLLSGKKVTLMGYSSKFVSLLSNFGYTKKDLKQVSRGDAEPLIQALNEINPEKEFLQLDSPLNTLNLFRKINIEFADRLIKNDIISEYHLKHQNIKKT